MFNKLIAFLMFAPDIYQNAYTGEASKAQLDAMTKAKNADFTATLTYYVAEKVGGNTSTKDNAGNPNEYFMLRARVVKPDTLVEDARRFAAAVSRGDAYLTNVLPSTTTTTAAP